MAAVPPALLARSVRGRRPVVPDAPHAALGVADRVLPRAVVRVPRRVDDLGTRGARALEVGVDIVDGQVGGERALEAALGPSAGSLPSMTCWPAKASSAWATVPPGPGWTARRSKPKARSSQSIAAGASR